jgi:glycosyltransferase involved in cell wall biosynthesis
VRVAAVVGDVPNTGHGGAALTAYSFIASLLEAGHEVTTISVLWDASDPRLRERIEALERLGSEVVVITPEPAPPLSGWVARAAYARSLVWPSLETTLPAIRLAPKVRDAISKAGADAVVAYGTNAVPATVDETSVPVMGLMSDPPGLSRRLRMRWEPGVPWSWHLQPLLFRAGEFSYARLVDRRLVRILRRFATVGMFGAHHAEWARRQGISAWYARSPIVDSAGRDWWERRVAATRPPRPKILMIGHLRGIATISGLHLFVESILPGLVEALGEDGFEVHIVGGYEPPRSIAGHLRHPSVRLRGQIEPADDEFLSSDVLLVPTPIRTGPRSRILTGMSFGSCVVAHEANRLGIPELRDGVNCLLAGDGPGLTHAVLRAVGDAPLRVSIGAEARAVYEQSFTPEVAGGAIVQELERLAARGSAPISAGV